MPKLLFWFYAAYIITSGICYKIFISKVTGRISKVAVFSKNLIVKFYGHYIFISEKRFLTSNLVSSHFPFLKPLYGLQSFLLITSPYWIYWKLFYCLLFHNILRLVKVQEIVIHNYFYSIIYLWFTNCIRGTLILLFVNVLSIKLLNWSKTFSTTHTHTIYLKCAATTTITRITCHPLQTNSNTTALFFLTSTTTCNW